MAVPLKNSTTCRKLTNEAESYEYVISSYRGTNELRYPDTYCLSTLPKYYLTTNLLYFASTCDSIPCSPFSESDGNYILTPVVTYGPCDVKAQLTNVASFIASCAKYPDHFKGLMVLTNTQADFDAFHVLTPNSTFSKPFVSDVAPILAFPPHTSSEWNNLFNTRGVIVSGNNGSVVANRSFPTMDIFRVDFKPVESGVRNDNLASFSSALLWGTGIVLLLIAVSCGFCFWSGYLQRKKGAVTVVGPAQVVGPTTATVGLTRGDHHGLPGYGQRPPPPPPTYFEMHDVRV
ncbi:hypothetical protein BJ742DRAFT_843372 [Cladochytrium replicatum]|nr:hypothetical protein BJ742DRAFT_843372 [Cladochytrium replicatum]